MAITKLGFNGVFWISNESSTLKKNVKESFD